MNKDKLCNLCPNNCNADRDKNKGFCNATNTLRIAKFYLHKFEEPCISGTNGSGTIFFTGCSLKCPFCQNFELSRNLRGKDITTRELADIFKALEDIGAHNINLVTPTHYFNKIKDALDIYKPKVPIIYNTHAYEHLHVLKDVINYVDVFLPDMKFYSPEVSFRYVNKADYFSVTSKAIEFMINNKPLRFENGLIKSGVIVRHLVLPQNVFDSKKILEWFSDYKDNAYINVMSQFTPFGDVEKFPELNRKLTAREYDTVINYANDLGITNLFYQKLKSSSTEYIPKWDF